MATQTHTLEAEDRAKTAASSGPEALALEAVLENVRRDSKKDAPLYLDESTVPHGGE